ncbi:unnamed protein product [Gongylonema pulchrum]|uniref:Neur_chan_LBD domain-containing protein n=1 Tax=Gongylonema pulchrum TaxID=637853 RepID=A0A183E2H6_9BILA|nr:unnamed protein product [Gongylonema pulchrum]
MPAKVTGLDQKVLFEQRLLFGNELLITDIWVEVNSFMSTALMIFFRKFDLLTAFIAQKWFYLVAATFKCKGTLTPE